MVHFTKWPTPVEYGEAVAAMEHSVGVLQKDHATEAIWFLEHPPVYTQTLRSKPILQAVKAPIVLTPRGGLTTFHGPGQRIIYVLINLRARKMMVSEYVRQLEGWIQRTLEDLGAEVYKASPHPGVWVQHPAKGVCKIASLGVRIQQGITSHGIALNVFTDLTAFQAITPCGLEASSMTSLKDLGVQGGYEEVDARLLAQCPFSLQEPFL